MMNFKSLQILAVLLMYSPVLVLGNTHATICVTEQGRTQIEFGIAVCDLLAVEIISTNSAEECGDCTDSNVKIGETHRVTINNSCDFLTIQPVLASATTDQQTLATTIHFPPSAPVSNLVGSSILII